MDLNVTSVHSLSSSYGVGARRRRVKSNSVWFGVTSQIPSNCSRQLIIALGSNILLFGYGYYSSCSLVLLLVFLCSNDHLGIVKISNCKTKSSS